MSLTNVFKVLLLLLSIVSVLKSSAQDYPYTIQHYDFVNYELNKLQFFGDSSKFDSLFGIFNGLILQGVGQLNIVHIGGSHIQAGALSGHISDRLQHFYPGLKGGRGFVFPYKMANTNGPRNYQVVYTGKWDNCMNVERNRICRLGLSGIALTTSDSVATINIALNDDLYPEYDFNLVKVFHNCDSAGYCLEIMTPEPVRPIDINYDKGYSLFMLDKFLDTLNLKISKCDTLDTPFALYGFSLETTEPGINYHAIGVNGANIPAYLRCELFENHLTALNPKWIILTLGTNDAYTKKFSPEQFEQNYDLLLNRIKLAAPNAAIIITVPNDSYLYKRYVNRNTEKVKDVIIKLAQKHSCAVWDFYSIMGGLNSITLWNKANLTASDKLHFNRNGYFLQADLFFNAFLKAYDNYIDKNAGKISNNH